MTEELDLDAIQMRHDEAHDHVGSGSWLSAADVPDLLEEVERLRALVTGTDVAYGWKAAQKALRAEAAHYQEDGNLTMWAALAVSADHLDRIPYPHQEEEVGPEGFIDVEKRKGVQKWTLTCSDCGLVGKYPMVLLVENERPEPELAWDWHVQERHS